MTPVLIALGAELVLRSGDKTRTVAVQDYFVSYKVTVLQPGEFIELIRIPRAKPEHLFQVYKISKRLEDDISAVCGAFYLHLVDNQVQDARIAYGGMAEIPKRASHCEAALVGKPWQQSSVDQAMLALGKDFSPISDFRASAEYRQRVAANLLHRVLLESSEPATPVRVTHYA